MRNRLVEDWIMNNTQEGQDVDNGLDLDTYNKLSDDDKWRYVEGLEVDFENVEPIDKAQSRKDTPVFSGVLKYFPNALKAVAKCSKAGNDQHHPDKPLHWDMDKSSDEYDAMVRHLIDHQENPVDDDNVLHLTKVAWRALAGLERYLTGKLDEGQH